MTFLNVVTFWSTIQSYCICRVYFWGVYFWEVLHCRCEWTQTQQAQYNEFVENGSKSWALMRRRLVLGVKNKQNRTGERPREKGPLAWGRELPTPLASQEPLSFLWAFFFFFPHPPALGDFCCYISLSSVHPPPTLVSHPYLYLSAHPIGHSF